MPSTSKSDAYLLDTHVFVWLMLGEKALKQKDRLETAALTGGLLVSPISCWEIGMLSARGRLKLGVPCIDWIEQALKAPGLSLLDLTPQMAVEASYLPGEFHGDPADRILVACARVRNLTLATRDDKILEYGSQGHVPVLPC
jgi:PIN domain nuclease of toxin-antitoxin system